MSWLTRKSLRASTEPAAAELSAESLVTRHYGFVWRSLRGFGLSRTDAEDAAQQVFMIAARKLHEITTERTQSFLYGTARRVANNTRRGLRRRSEVAVEDTENIQVELSGPDHAADLRHARALLSELLDQLPEDLRRVLVLAEIEQLEVQQIAELEAIPVGTAASRLRRARQRFRVLLESVQQRNPFAREA